METRDHSSFVATRLPWLVGAAGFVAYLLTLNRWMSLASLSTAGILTDPAGTPPLTGPLHYLLAVGLRCLPASATLMASNVVSAALAAVVLGLLAACVGLLPHDRTRDERRRERNEHSLLSLPSAWLPPLFASAVLGFQLSFWEHATAGTGEMLDLVFFAYVIYALLRFRIDREERRLTRMSFVYGVAVVNNFAMIAYLPLVVAALAWISGRDFFRWRFLVRMTLWGLAGLSLYLVLPVWRMLTVTGDQGFWWSLKLQWVTQKRLLQSAPRWLLYIVGMTSLLPLLLIGIRWPSSFGDTSVVGNVLTNLMFKVVNGLFLVAGVMVMFDAPWSARWQMDQLLEQAGMVAAGTPYLTLYFLCALGLGYFVGYYLLVFGEEQGSRWHRTSMFERLLNSVVVAVVMVGVALVPAGLVYRNLRWVRAGDGTLLRDFARLASQGLPKEPAVALSDNSSLLLLVQAYQRQARPGEGTLFVDTTLLPYAIYQEGLHARAPALWPKPPAWQGGPGVFSPEYLALTVGGVAISNQLFYLHPSFGYYFEPLYPVVDGMTYRLLPFATNQTLPPALSSNAMARTSKFWEDAAPVLDRVARLGARGAPEARAVARWYSRALNAWGVELQRANRLEPARAAFERAVGLNQDNLLAAANLEFNARLRGHAPAIEAGRATLDERLGSKFRNWSVTMGNSGPVDQPQLSFALGKVLAEQSLFRQAIREFDRVANVSTNRVQALFWMAGVYQTVSMPDRVLEVLARVGESAKDRPLSLDEQLELIRMQAMALVQQGQRGEAEAKLLAARRDHPDAAGILDTLVQLYADTDRTPEAMQLLAVQLKRVPGDKASQLSLAGLAMRTGDYPVAATAVAEVLKLEPANSAALLLQSAVLIQLKRYAEAVAPAGRLLEQEPRNQAARFNHAIALLESGQLDAAESDYQRLASELPTMHRVHYGLAQIAERRKDRTAAIRYFEAYLKYAPADSPEAQQVAARLKQLKSGAP